VVLVGAGLGLVVYLVVVAPSFYLALANDLSAEVHEDLVDVCFWCGWVSYDDMEGWEMLQREWEREIEGGKKKEAILFTSTSSGCLVVRSISPAVRDAEGFRSGHDSLPLQVGLVAYDDERDGLVFLDTDDLLAQPRELVQAAEGGDGEDEQKALPALNVELSALALLLVSVISVISVISEVEIGR
jgi:hypothetical protein